MRYLLSGHSLALDPALCNACGRCEEVCPHAVFAMADRKAVIVRRDECMECGACRTNCPVQAIAVSSGVGCAAAILDGMRRKAAGRGDGSASCACS